MVTQAQAFFVFGSPRLVKVQNTPTRKGIGVVALRHIAVRVLVVPFGSFSLSEASMTSFEDFRRFNRWVFASAVKARGSYVRTTRGLGSEEGPEPKVMPTGGHPLACF